MADLGGGGPARPSDGMALQAAQPVQVDDIALIGGGPVGLFGAFYAGLRGLKTRLFESLPQPGGQLTALYPEKFIYDVPGFPRVQAKELVARLVEQAMQFNPQVMLNTPVTGLQQRPDGGIFVLTTARGVFFAKVVIVTAGLGAFSPKKLAAPGVAEFEGKGVHYWLDDLSRFRGRRALVVGGGDSAVDFALMLQPVARHVTLIHRRDGFRAHEQSVKQLYASGVEVLVFHELKRLEGGEAVERAVVFDNRTGAERVLDVQHVVFALGFSADLGPMREWGLELEDEAIRVNSFKMETAVAGVYAAGDIATYPGKVKLIATGFGEVATAVNNACRYIDPSLPVFPGHSSNRKAVSR